MTSILVTERLNAVSESNLPLHHDDYVSSPTSRFNQKQDLSLLSPAGLLVLILVLIGTSWFYVVDDFTFVDSLYSACGIVSTVGIMIPPTSGQSKVFISLLNLASLGVGAIYINEIGSIRASLGRAGFSSNFGKEAVSLAVNMFVPICVAAMVFSYLEDWPILSSVYVASCVGTGLGLDAILEPHSPITKIFFSCYTFYQMGLMINVLSLFAFFIRDKFANYLIG